MDEQVDEGINRYYEYFTGQITQIQSISGESSGLYKKILFCSFLDALSRSAYPRKRPGDRFTSLIRRFGQWTHQDRVSLPHLVRLLQLAPDPAFENLRKFALERITAWKAPWNGIKLDHDPHRDEIEKLWPSAKEHKIPIGGVSLLLLTHLQLLYSHRNFLVHEYRHPGHDFDMPGEDEPYYHDMETLDSENEPPIETIELVYPVKFFEKLSVTVLSGLKEYFKENHLNPFDYYKFGSYWIEELN